MPYGKKKDKGMSHNKAARKSDGSRVIQALRRTFGNNKPKMGYMDPKMYEKKPKSAGLKALADKNPELTYTPKMYGKKPKMGYMKPKMGCGLPGPRGKKK
jgi:hypothetical protein